MRDNYRKPTIYFESFALSQSIAKGCKLITEGEDEVIYDPNSGEEVFVWGADGPACTPNGDGLCYDVPFESSVVFSS